MSEELTEAQKIVLKHASQEYDRKLKTWSIETALTTLNVTKPSMPLTAADVLSQAEVFIQYILKTPKEWPVPSAAQAEHMLSELQQRGEVPMENAA